MTEPTGAGGSTSPAGRAGDLYDPLGEDHRADPYPSLRRLRESDPVHWSERYGMWVVSTFDDVQDALADPARFSSRTPPTGQVALCAAASTIMAGLDPLPDTLISADPPAQTNNRRPLQRALSVRRIAGLAPSVRRRCTAMVSTILDAGAVEFVSAFASPFPVAVIAELLGVPRSARGRFKAWADDLALGLSAGLSDREQVRVALSTREVRSFFASLLGDRRRRDRGDLLSELVRTTRPDGTPFRDDELLSLCQQLLVAGHETTTSLLSGMMLVLATHEGVLPLLVARPDLRDRFVEEALRHLSPVQGRYRVAACPVVRRGRTIEAGSRVQLLLAAANRDPAAFPDPDRFDVGRENLSQHLAFGFGPHFCVGAALARLEARVALDELVTRAGGIELTGGQLTWQSHFHLRALRELHVRVTRRGPSDRPPP